MAGPPADPGDEPLEGEPEAVPAAPAVDAPAAEEVPPAPGVVEAPVDVLVVAPAGGGTPPPPPHAGMGPGAAPVGAWGIGLLVALYFVLSVLCIYFLLALWPTQAGLTTPATTTTAAAETTEGGEEQEGETEGGAEGEAVAEPEPTEAQPTEPPPKEVEIFGYGPWSVDIEVLFFLVVGLTGAIGGSVAAVRSLGIYVGSRTLTRSWIPFYVFKPLLGALLAIVLYLVLRAGLFSPSASNAQVSPYGFAAIAALAGIFAEHAAEKLRRVAVEFFNEPYETPPPEHYAAEGAENGAPPDEQQQGQQV